MHSTRCVRIKHFTLSLFVVFGCVNFHFGSSLLKIFIYLYFSNTEFVLNKGENKMNCLSNSVGLCCFIVSVKMKNFQFVYKMKNDFVCFSILSVSFQLILIHFFISFFFSSLNKCILQFINSFCSASAKFLSCDLKISHHKTKVKFNVAIILTEVIGNIVHMFKFYISVSFTKQTSYAYYQTKFIINGATELRDYSFVSFISLYCNSKRLYCTKNTACFFSLAVNTKSVINIIHLKFFKSTTAAAAIATVAVQQ